MLNRFSQQVKAAAGVNEKTSDADYHTVKEEVKSMRNVCKDTAHKMSECVKGLEAMCAGVICVHEGFEAFLTACEGHQQGQHKQLTLAGRQLSDTTQEINTQVLPALRESTGECKQHIANYDAELKKLEKLRDIRSKKKDSYDYHRNDVLAKEEELRKSKRDPTTSGSLARKVQKRDEAQQEYETANDEAKTAMCASMQKRDSVMANFLQLYLRSIGDVMSSVQRRYTDLHTLTLPRRASPAPVVDAAGAATDTATEGGAGVPSLIPSASDAHDSVPSSPTASREGTLKQDGSIPVVEAPSTPLHITDHAVEAATATQASLFADPGGDMAGLATQPQAPPAGPQPQVGTVPSPVIASPPSGVVAPAPLQAAPAPAVAASLFDAGLVSPPPAPAASSPQALSEQPSSPFSKEAVQAAFSGVPASDKAVASPASPLRPPPITAAVAVPASPPLGAPAPLVVPTADRAASPPSVVASPVAAQSSPSSPAVQQQQQQAPPVAVPAVASPQAQQQAVPLQPVAAVPGPALCVSDIFPSVACLSTPVEEKRAEAARQELWQDLQDPQKAADAVAAAQGDDWLEAGTDQSASGADWWPQEAPPPAGAQPAAPASPAAGSPAPAAPVPIPPVPAPVPAVAAPQQPPAVPAAAAQPVAEDPLQAIYDTPVALPPDIQSPENPALGVPQAGVPAEVAAAAVPGSAGDEWLTGGEQPDGEPGFAWPAAAAPAPAVPAVAAVVVPAAAPVVPVATADDLDGIYARQQEIKVPASPSDESSAAPAVVPGAPAEPSSS